jgi:hypothetical protein
MLSEEQMKDLHRQFTEIREHLQKLSLHVVQMFRLVEISEVPLSEGEDSTPHEGRSI